jgi:hypothetical protein
MMLPTQIGDRTDEGYQGDGCSATTTGMFEYGTYLIYWAQSVVSWMF